METSSRRAFALDSRTVWVEQQILGNGSIVGRDNLALGPGEYHVQSLDRHVSTPSLGGAKGNADFFKPFQSDLRIRTPLGTGSPSRARSSGLRDFSTIHHDNGARNPLDPNRAFTPTPGSYLGSDHNPQKVLYGVPFGGLNTTRNADGLVVDHGDRFPKKSALPDYDPKFDSPQLRPAAKLGTFEKTRRIYIPSSEEKAPPRAPGRGSPGVPERGGGSLVLYKSQSLSNGSASAPPKMSVFQTRCSLVPLPRLKYRTPPQLTFDTSSYNIKARPADLNPKKINDQARANLYDSILAIPRQHYSCGVAQKHSLKSGDDDSSQ
ncbi:hypothetical protein B484DRAFT_402159 [Ochromonadaceae sp. CCMP2298]|nr:hypothetical protein B484DRAFT_402159 [Ochromonadaceae sp. CCMP2298]|mmetsp:Transcript_22724/g.50539  ORF Transcript_22724/g.50539 Transcript_22724/m.50539 type:complete len:321 (-) Transcript_22724:122-1084(-)